MKTKVSEQPRIEKQENALQTLFAEARKLAVSYPKLQEWVRGAIISADTKVGQDQEKFVWLVRPLCRSNVDLKSFPALYNAIFEVWRETMPNLDTKDFILIGAELTQLMPGAKELGNIRNKLSDILRDDSAINTMTAARINQTLSIMDYIDYLPATTLLGLAKRVDQLAPDVMRGNEAPEVVGSLVYNFSRSKVCPEDFFRSAIGFFKEESAKFKPAALVDFISGLAESGLRLSRAEGQEVFDLLCSNYLTNPEAFKKKLLPCLAKALVMFAEICADCKLGGLKEFVASIVQEYKKPDVTARQVSPRRQAISEVILSQAAISLGLMNAADFPIAAARFLENRQAYSAPNPLENILYEWIAEIGTPLADTLRRIPELGLKSLRIDRNVMVLGIEVDLMLQIGPLRIAIELDDRYSHYQMGSNVSARDVRHNSLTSRPSIGDKQPQFLLGTCLEIRKREEGSNPLIFQLNGKDYFQDRLLKSQGFQVVHIYFSDMLGLREVSPEQRKNLLAKRLLTAFTISAQRIFGERKVFNCMPDGMLGEDGKVISLPEELISDFQALN